MKILYLTSGNLWKSSGNSIQIFDELEELRRRGHQADLLLMPHRALPEKERASVELLRRRLAGKGTRLLTIPLLSDQRPYLQPLLMAWYGRQLDRIAPRYDLLQAHDLRTAALAARCRRRGKARRFIYDLHGAALAEAVFSGSMHEGDPVHRQRTGWERSGVAAADGCFVVSDFFRDWLVKTYGVDPARVWVTPSSTHLGPLPDADWRRRKRAELGIGERPVLLYSGSMHRWQRAADLLGLYPALARRVPGLFLLILTRETELAAKAVRKTGIAAADQRVLSLAPEEVQAMMSLGDVGALLRHPHLLNQVASPVKFADYLGAGVPVIITPGVGDCSRLVEESGLGLVWREDRGEEALVEGLAGLLARRDDDQRAACRELCRRHFSWDATMKVFDMAYENLRLQLSELDMIKCEENE